MATGNSYRSLGFSFRMGFSTVGQIVKECCQAIWESLKAIYIPEPEEIKWKEIAKDFEEIWGFPHCLGALDGKHIQMRCPYNGGSSYHNYKGTHSIVLLALVDANYKFIMVDVGAFGRNSDGGTFERSIFGQKCAKNLLHFPKAEKLDASGDPCDFVIVADEAFPLKTYIMRPFAKNSINGDQEFFFNYRLSRARRVVENAFGILAGRWRVFLKPLEVQPETVDSIVLASCCLHNMLRVSRNTNFEKRIQASVTEIQALEDLQSIRRNHVREAAAVRESFKKHFVTQEGASKCPWQWEAIRKGRIS